MSRAKNWCFTLNNYTDHDINSLESLVKDGKAVYLCYQKETSPTTGTPHLQGYVSLPENKRLAGMRKLCPAHYVLANGTPSSNRTYCSKEDSAIPGSFKEFGTLPDPKENQGKRNDFNVYQEAVKNGLSCKRKAREDFPELVAKYPRWCYDILSDKKDIQVQDFPLYEWQQELADTLLALPDDRTVTFVIDKKGNQGKTWFAKNYCKYNSDAQFMEPAKKADMAYALQDDLRVLFLIREG